MSEKIIEAIENLQAVMMEEGIDPRHGLPKELFHFATTLMPCPNIDLFITKGRSLLLTWRDDEFYGKGWHIPGGCLRMMETLDNRIQETALKELGTAVRYDRENFITRESIIDVERPWLKNQLERAHNISMLFNCQLPKEYAFENTAQEGKAGCVKWFDHKPVDLLPAHEKLYGDIIEKFFKGELKWKM